MRIVHGQIYGCMPLMALQSATRPGSPDRACPAMSSSGLPISLIHTFLHVVTCVCFFVKTNFKIICLGLLLAFAYQGKDIIVFRFIIEYSSLRDFYRPLGNNNNRSLFIWGFLKHDNFCLSWNLSLVYRVIISWRILVSLRGFVEDYIFAWWNIWVWIIPPLP